MDLLTIAVNNGIGFTCALAVLWLSFYRETKTIPALVAEFALAQNRTLEAFSKGIKDMEDGFGLRQAKLLDAFSQTTHEERQLCLRWHDQHTEGLSRLAEETKENRHLMKDLVHTLGLRKAVEEERNKRGQPPEA